tara:strand:- start:556 stop:750 length:195 start_codon:yes stop_codon:yes gene_type:complete
MVKVKEVVKINKENLDKLTIQILQQCFDEEIEELEKHLDWKRYEKVLRNLEDVPDKEDFPDNDK